jgi:hypothetical protein
LGVNNLGEHVSAIPLDVLLKSELISQEESYSLIINYASRPLLTVPEVIELDLPAKNRVDALLNSEVLSEYKLRDLACDFAQHTLYVFEAQSPKDHRPHECIAIARLLHAEGIGSWEMLHEIIKETQPAMWQFQGTEHVGAYEACRAALLHDYEDAAWVAREVAVCAQIAAHRYVWENKKSWSEPMIARENEAIRQLRKIVEVLT